MDQILMNKRRKKEVKLENKDGLKVKKGDKE